MPEGNFSPETSPSAGGPNLHEAPAIPGQSGIEAPQSLPHQTLPHVGDRPLHPGGLEAAIKPIAGGATNEPPPQEEPIRLILHGPGGEYRGVHEIPRRPTVSTEPSGIPPPEGSETAAGAGAGGGEMPPVIPPTAEAAPGPEGPRGPEDRENIWGPDFEKEGRSYARNIIHLESLGEKIGEAKKYLERVSGLDLNAYYSEWKKWVRKSGKRSFTRRPFIRKQDEIEAFEQAEQARIEKEAREIKERERQQTEEIKEQDLTGLPSATELFELYKNLRKKTDGADPPLTDEQREAQILDTEVKLGRYFLEARRLGLLESADDGLRMMYVDIMRGRYPSEANRKLSAPEVWKIIRASQKTALDLGNENLEAEALEKWKSGYDFAKLEGVIDVYLKRTINERFSKLINNGTGLIAEERINGEFKVEGGSLEQLNEIAKNIDFLREKLPSDEVLRTQAELAFEGDEGLIKEELVRLVNKREAALKMAVGDLEGAAARQVADMERYRQMQEERSLFWKPTYASYFEVFAKTPEEFQIVIDTFTDWIRSGVSKSPPELFQRVRGMIDALTTAGQREGQTAFVTGCKEELEAMIAVLGGSDANERYNAAYFKQFMDSLAQDTGPARMLRLAKANRGKVASILHKFDLDSRMELLFSSHGSRGQLLLDRSPIEQELLQKEILNMLILETMAVEFKAYDPRDPLKITTSQYETAIGNIEEKIKYLKTQSGSGAEITRLQGMIKILKDNPAGDNMAELIKFQTGNERFEDLFDGFNQEDQERLYQSLEPTYTLWQSYLNIQKKFQGVYDPPNLTEAEYAINERFKRGNHPPRLSAAEEAYVSRLISVRKIQKAYLDGEFDPDNARNFLKGEELKMFNEAKNAVQLAYEMYGVMGEKAKRGGAVLLVDRYKVENGNPILEFTDTIAMHWGEKLAHFAENWVKATYGGELDDDVSASLGLKNGLPVKGIGARELQFRVDQARRMAMWALKTQGFDAKLFDFTLLREGKPVDPNTLGYSKFGENTDVPLTSPDRFKYAPPKNPRCIGYATKGKNKEKFPVIITFDNDGKIKHKGLVNEDGEVYDLEVEDGNIVVYDTGGGKIRFDNLRTDVEAKEMMLYEPTLNPDGTLYKNDKGETVPKKVKVDFWKAVRHIYGRWTGHAYWGYQEEDVQLIMQAREGALRIKKGLSRPEDESPHCTELLMADPSLEGMVPYGKEDIDDLIGGAMVEASYQGHWRITDELHQMFYAPDADKKYTRIAYNLQDFGGSTKMWEAGRALGMRWTEAMARRGRTMLPTLPLHFASMAEIWGARSGALDVIRMMGFGEYRMVGQFAMEKWINQTEAIQDLFEALTGYMSPQEKRGREGYLEKPTDDADTLWSEFLTLVKNLLKSNEEDTDNRYINLVRKTKGRFETVCQRIRVLETEKRGEKAPLWLEGQDLWLRNPDGSIAYENGKRKLNWEIIPKKASDTGTSRHSGTLFFWRGIRWLRSSKPSEGEDCYADTKKYYSPMDGFTNESRNRLGAAIQAAGAKVDVKKIFSGEIELRSLGEEINRKIGEKLTTRWQWLLGKLVR